MNTVAGKAQLRAELRNRRRALTSRQQALAAQSLLDHISRLPWFNRARCIALYWPGDGELDPRPVARLAWQRGIACYLPVLHPWCQRQLWFTPYTPNTCFRPNRFGIPEPVKHQAAPLSPRYLDIVFLPLVGFDRDGGRLGMGGGFYDTTFAFKRRCKGFVKPRLIGLAHTCQEVEKLPLDPWDMGLDGVVTEKGPVTGRVF